MLKHGSTPGGGGQQLQLPQQYLVPQVWGTHVWKHPEVHPSLLRGQGSSHSAQDCCAENGPGGTALPLSTGEMGGEERGQAGTPGTALLRCSPSALGGFSHGRMVSRSGPAQSAMTYSPHSLEQRTPALWLAVQSHPILPSQCISGPSSLAISHCSSLLRQVFYNNKGYHSMPTYLNALNNAILRANLPKSKGNPAAYGEDLEVFEGRSMSGTALGHGPTRLQSARAHLGSSRLVSSWNRGSHT